MIEELIEKDFPKVKKLFGERPFINRFRSHLERTNVPKQVFVDNTDDPQTAVIVVFLHDSFTVEFYFGGRADNEEFNKELRIDPDCVNKGDKILDIRCFFSNSGWEEGIKSILKDPTFYNRYYHEIKELKLKNWRELIPEGYSIEPVDLTLLEKNYLNDYGWYDWLFHVPLKKHWFPFEECLKENRGFLLIREDDEIVSFCTQEFLTEENDIEMNIATKAEYRRRGFASIVGSATAEICLSRYDSVGWHCTSTNIGSYKTAEKIGYERIKEHKGVLAYINHVDNWILNGFLKSQNKVLESDPNNSFLLNVKAYLLAKLNRKEESIKIIQDLVERESHDGNLYDTYGEILQIFYDYKEAIMKFQKALELEPNGSFAQYSYIKMAECYKELGNYEKTIEYGKKGRELAIKKKEEEWVKRADKLLFESKK